MDSQQSLENGEVTLRALMVAEYGPLLTGNDLVNALGYPTPSAFWQARRCDRLQVRTFRIPGRRGTFALTVDVADWLTSVADESAS